MTLMEEMGLVMRTIPGPHATLEEVASWYERKASLLERIADEANEDRNSAAVALSQAEAAHRHAREIMPNGQVTSGEINKQSR